MTQNFPARLDIRDPISGRVYFGHAELMDRSTGEGRLAPGFSAALLALRLDFGEKMFPTSCCRSAERNRIVGGHPRSLHVYDKPHWPTEGCCSIDINLARWGRRAEDYFEALAKVAWDRGWSIGDGRHRGFIHLDRRTHVLGFRQARFSY